ncbi:MAG: ABC transporter permease [archaeon]
MELLNIVIQNMRVRKGRTALTLIGIIIGISVVVALVSASQGLTQEFEDQLEGLGYDKIMIYAAGMNMMATNLFTQGDIDTINKVQGVELVGGMAMAQTPVEFRNELKTSWIAGMDAEEARELFFEGTGMNLYSGRWPRGGESHVALIGWLVHNDQYTKDVDLGDTIKIGETEFKVIGVVDEIGNSQDDTNIYIETEEFWDIFGQRGTYAAILARTTPGADPKKIAEVIDRRLERYRDAEDFDVFTMDQLAEQIADVMKTLTTVLTGIAAISLIVGGIGIMNTMLMNVVERTKEIGIMKAVGATERQIISIFLAEAVVISLIGGTIGIVFGHVLTRAIAFGVKMAGATIQTPLGLYTIILAYVFSAAVGITSGIYPAIKAAKLDPVESLRYE